MFILTVHLNKWILCWKFNLIFFLQYAHNLCLLGMKHCFLLLCSILFVALLSVLPVPFFVLVYVL